MPEAPNSVRRHLCRSGSAGVFDETEHNGPVLSAAKRLITWCCVVVAGVQISSKIFDLQSRSATGYTGDNHRKAKAAKHSNGKLPN